MAELTYTAIPPAGINDATLTAADAAGDKFPAMTGVFIKVANGDSSPHTVTIAKPKADTICGNYGKLPIADLSIVVTNAESRIFTVPLGYADSDGKFALTYDAVTSVTVGGFVPSPNS